MYLLIWHKEISVYRENYYTLDTTNCAAMNIRKTRSYICTGLQRTKVKGKDHPRTGHEVPAAEQMYSCTL